MRTGRSFTSRSPPSAAAAGRCRPARPGRRGPSATVPSAGASTWCSIFIASTTTSGWPAATASPAPTSTRSTLPGIGATSDPAVSAASGSGWRGSTRERDVAVVGVDEALVAVAADAVRAAQPGVVEHDLVGRRRDDDGRRRSRPVDGDVAVAAEAVRHPDRLLVEGQLDDLVDGRVVAPARRDAGEHASPRRGWRPARPARRPPRRAATSPRIGSVHGYSSRKPVCRSPATNVGVAQDVEQLVAVGDRAVEPRPSESQRVEPADRRRRGCAPWRDHLGDHRVVVRRHGRARTRSPVSTRTPRPVVVEAVERAGRRPVAGGRILGREADLDGVPEHGPDVDVDVGSGAPSATRSCRATRSSPVISSVTGCSTCRRVFISRNQNPPSGSSRNSTVPAPT